MQEIWKRVTFTITFLHYAVFCIVVPYFTLSMVSFIESVSFILAWYHHKNEFPTLVDENRLKLIKAKMCTIYDLCVVAGYAWSPKSCWYSPFHGSGQHQPQTTTGVQSRRCGSFPRAIQGHWRLASASGANQFLIHIQRLNAC